MLDGKHVTFQPVPVPLCEFIQNRVVEQVTHQWTDQFATNRGRESGIRRALLASTSVLEGIVSLP